ncbi:MAG TPA: SGNH/GDSL hydrolase family protein [Vicinamibacteria bacterium]|nr:SGNH/GDSL hydrolase family protein [Vicinamibacteria bacterium]
MTRTTAGGGGRAEPEDPTLIGETQSHQRRTPGPGELALLALGLLAALLLAEGAVRVTGTADRPTGYAPVNTKRNPGPTNTQGYRDRERSLTRPTGARRLVALGDSFTWGVKVEFDDTWPQRVERALGRARGEPWEVVSLARQGMNTVEEAEQLATEGLAYAPDGVVLGYCLNDSEDEDAAEVRRARDWEEMAKERAARGHRLLERSALYRLVQARLRATHENRWRLRAYRSQYAPDYPGWIAARKALGGMAERCRERKIPLVVMIFPLFGNPLGDAYPFAEIHAAVARAVADTGWARPLDLLPAYRALDWRLLVVDGANDEHPNEIAHRIAAERLVKVLADVLPPPPQPRGGGPAVTAR